MGKFYNFVNKSEKEADLYITGDIIGNDEQNFYDWWGIDGTSPKKFKAELDKHEGKTLNIVIDSYGGDVVAASTIYSLISNRSGETVVKISGMAASAASVIAMAGNKVLMSPTALMMIHNPLTSVYGNAGDLKAAIDTLKVVKESIVNAYERKTKLPRDTISQLMDKEEMFDVNKAMKFGFADGVWGDENVLLDGAVLDSIRNQRISIYNKVNAPLRLQNEPTAAVVEESEQTPTEGAQADTTENSTHSEQEINELSLKVKAALLKRF